MLMQPHTLPKFINTFLVFGKLIMINSNPLNLLIIRVDCVVPLLRLVVEIHCRHYAYAGIA